jgi:hypothetical protein
VLQDLPSLSCQRRPPWRWPASGACGILSGRIGRERALRASPGEVGVGRSCVNVDCSARSRLCCNVLRFWRWRCRFAGPRRRSSARQMLCETRFAVPPQRLIPRSATGRRFAGDFKDRKSSARPTALAKQLYLHPQYLLQRFHGHWRTPRSSRSTPLAACATSSPTPLARRPHQHAAASDAILAGGTQRAGAARHRGAGSGAQGAAPGGAGERQAGRRHHRRVHWHRQDHRDVPGR